MEFKKFDLESIVINIFFSSVITLTMFIFTFVFSWYLWQVNINSEPIGVFVLMFDFVCSFIALHVLFNH